MPTDEKKLTVEQKMDKAFQTVQIKNQDIINDPFNASTRLISATQLDVDRFNTYETKTYGKLGFDPFKDNNEVFNRNTSSGEDLSRAFTGMIKLAGVGLQDTFGFGLMAGEDNWKDFDQIMKNYSSTRGGYTQFWANTMLSSGYTVGILTAIAAEEIGLALTTGGLGNLGSAGLIGTQLARGFSKLGKITESSRVLERVATLGRVKEGTKLFSLKGLGNGSLRLLKKLNPVSETMDFAYNVSKLDNLNAWQKLATGAGSIARDARKIYMVHSESRLEAELARNDFKNQKINEARMASETGVLTDADIHRIGVDGDRVYAGTYSKNLGLIYVTNSITFDNMFKSMRYNNKMFVSGGSRFRTTLGKAGLVVNAVKNTTVKGTAKAAWKGIANFSVSGSAKSAKTFVKENWKAKGKSLLKKSLTNSMEGIQEVGQDVISNSVKSYVGRNHTGSQARGGFLEYMWNDVGTATKDLATKRDEQGNLTYEGLSTFGSGFFMGAFAAPFGAGISYFQKQVVGGGAKAKAEYLFSRKSYVAKQKTQYRKALAKATVLTEIFNQNLGSYLETTTLPFIAQTELQEDILTASKNNDKKGFEDKKEESFQNGIKTMLKNNTESEFTDFLEDMVNNYTVQEMNQAMGRTDITKDNVAEYKEKLSKKSKSIKSYRAKYNEINELIVDPIMQSDIDRLDINDPVQREEKLRLMINKRAISNLKDELLFNNGKIANKAQRMGALQEQIHRETKLSTTEVQALISKKGLASEIKLLAAQVAGNKGLNLQGADLEAANIAKAKLETFTEYQKALAKVEEIESNEDSTVDEIESAYSTMFEAYHKLRTLDSEFGIGEPEEVKRAISRKSFNAITDYLDLSSESDVLQAAVNTLLDPESASMWLEKNSEMMLDIDKNKETHIANQLIAFAEKAESSTMLINLQQEGLFFDLNELDDLVEKGIMPSAIYNIATNKPASKEEYQKAQDIISQFYKRLTGKTITQDKSTTKKTSARSKKDKRTAKTLVRDYGIKLDKEIDLSDPVQLERLIEKLKASKQLTYIEKELLDAVKDSTPKIMFTESGELPISVNEKGVFVIDIRYASADYKNAKVSFETLVLSALTQSKLNASLEEDAELKKEVEDLMTQARDAFAKKYPNQGAEEMSVFNNTDEFLSEALNNTSFQGFLGSVNDTVSGEKESLWKTLMAKLMLVFNKTFDKSMLQRAVSLANMALDESVVENIDEKVEVADDTPAVEQEVGDLESVSSEDIEEFTISEVVPGVFQVTGDGNVVAFDTKAEADAYVKEKTGPIKKTVKQTVKQKVKRTIELGNTISIENARDRPDLFGDYLFPEVVAGDLLLAAEWAKKAEELGKELDDAGVTDWKYGEIRVDIDGRLVIDVSAEIPTYELRKKATKAANAKIQQLQDELKAIEKNIADLNNSIQPSTADNIKNRKRKDLFPDESEFAQVVGDSEIDLKNEIKKARLIEKNENKAKQLEAELKKRESKISSYKEVNGIGIAEYTNPVNNVIDIIMSGTSDNDYVGYVRIYENGKPTNRWTSKMENKSQNKANIKTMLAEVQRLLPAGHEYTEKTNISLDGLKTYAQQLEYGYEILLDNNGNPVVNQIILNKASVSALQNAKSEKEINDLYKSYENLTRAEYNEIKAKINALMPEARVLPFNEANGTISINLPVLKSTQSSTDIKDNKGVADEIEDLNQRIKDYEDSVSGKVKVDGKVPTQEQIEDWNGMVLFFKWELNLLLNDPIAYFEKEIKWMKNSTVVDWSDKIKQHENTIKLLSSKSTNNAGTTTGTKGRFLDSQVVIKRETISVINEENDVNIEYKVKTFLDGSVQWDYKSKDGVWGPDKTMGSRSLNDVIEINEKYGGTVKLIKTEDYTKIQNPKMWNGLSSEQKQKVDSERFNKESSVTTDTTADIEINPLVAELEAKKRDVEKQLKNEPEYSESEVEERVQSGTKTVNFLMYKSTGTGSTAKSLGEWVPLLGFGLHPNKDEWFIKAYSNGVDPKLNKYGSSTFAAIDKDLKKNEAGLFTGARRTEEIEEEVDVEIDVEIEVPRDRAAREEEIRVDEEAQLKDEINKKRELLNTIDRQLASTSKLQFRKRINLDTQRKRLLIDLKDLQEKHDELSLQANKNVVLDPAVSQTTDVDAGEETQDNVDLDNKTIVTEKTSFSLLPEDLQDLLLEQFRSSVTQNSINDIRSVFSDLIKDLETLVVTTDMTDEEIKESDDILLEKLEKFNRVIGKKYNAKINAQSKVEISPAIDNSFATTDEQDAIQKLMGVDIAYIKTIIDYNKSVEPVEFVPAPIPEPTVELDDVSLARLNAEAMERAKQLTQERINREAEEARERRKARLSAKVPITEMERSDLTELLKRVLKLDFDILSEADVIMLIDNLIDSDINNSFKIPDVIAFVNKKKLDIKKQSEIDFIELAFAEELAKKESEAARKKALASYQKDLFEEFDNARVADNFASLKKSINNGDSFFINYNGKDVKFSITKMELATFALYNKDILKSDNIKEILVEIYKTMRSINATAKSYSKYSLPKENAEDELIKTFFRLKDSGFLYPSVVKAINTALYRDGVKLTIVKSNALSGSLYTIEARGMVAKKGPQNNLAVAKQIVRDYTENANPIDDLWREAMVAAWFSYAENRVNPQMITNDMSRGEEKIYKNFTSPKSKYKKMDALGEIIFADFLDEVEEYYNRGIGGVGDDVLTAFSHNSISQFIFDVADRIKKQNGVEDISNLEGFEEYISSKLADESSVLNEEYYNSLEFKIENGLIDASSFDFSTLTPSQQRLYDQTVDNGLYDSKPNLEGVVNTEDVVVEESSPFIIPVVEETAISKEGSALRKELNNLDKFEAQAHIKAVLNSSENFNNLKLFLAIHQIVNGERAQFTDEQKNIINDQIIRKLDQGFFAGMSIMNEGIPMQIVSYNKKDKTVELVDVSTGESKTISYNDFLNTTEVFEEGAEYNALNVDTVVNDQEIAYIKDAYQDIFNNFTQSVAEFEKLEESELNNKILEQLTKCK